MTEREDRINTYHSKFIKECFSSIIHSKITNFFNKSDGTLDGVVVVHLRVGLMSIEPALLAGQVRFDVLIEQELGKDEELLG